MWLLPLFAPVASVALRVFYRLTRRGAEVPARGPVLLVANHPNSLLDPAAVVAAAGRPVRFLAKAPLFTDPLVGWLIRGSGAIPVHRRQDDPAAMAGNDDTFRTVRVALRDGAAVGIFPEGISHSDPGMAPLRTGAARIALSTAADIGGSFPIIPIGLVFREKETFRTEALIVVGEPAEWSDLAAAGETAEGVRELTRRIDQALRQVTVNLERWEDARLVETAVAVHAAEVDRLDDDAERVARIREASLGLARLRASGEPDWQEVARELRAHRRALEILGMSPGELRAGNRADVAVMWAIRQVAFFGLGLPVAAVGAAFYLIPFLLTGRLEARMRPTQDVRGTTKLLIGAILHLVWTLGAAILIAWSAGPWPALGALVALPLAGWVALHVAERIRGAVGESRRFLLRERRRGTLADLRERQSRLAARLHALWLEVRRRAPA